MSSLLNSSHRVTPFMLCCALFALTLFSPALQAAQSAVPIWQGTVVNNVFSFSTLLIGAGNPLSSVLPLSSVSLVAVPSPVLVGKPLLLTATAIGGVTVEYQFYRRAGTSWQSMTGGKYLPAKTCSFTPTASGAQLFRVNAREVGSTTYFPGEFTITVCFPLSAVVLGIAPSPVVENKPLLLTATPNGGAALEYQFYRRLGSGWQSLTGDKYLPTKTCSYIPTATGSQLFRVNAREVGSTIYFPGEVTVVILSFDSENSTDGAEMVWVQGGMFTMGTPYYTWWNDPHTQQVTLSGYWMYKYEVTVAQYCAFCTATSRELPSFPSGYSWTGKSGWTDPALQQHPIVNVSWYDAKAYADWAGVLLPTEAQWEFASRGTQGYNFPWGGMAKENDAYNGWDKTKCANGYNSFEVGKSTWPVGSFSVGVSWCGAQDLAGNVWEWCADWYGDYSFTPVINPIGSILGNSRVMRGGSWVDTLFVGRGAHRGNDSPDILGFATGFRCVSLSPGPSLSAVKLVGVPSPVAVGRPLLLIATTTGSGMVEYQFYRRTGTTWQSLTGGKYLAAKTCSYTPTATGSQLFRVNARGVGSTTYFPGEVTVIVCVPLSAVALGAAPSAVVINKPLLLTATASGGSSVEYQFFRRTGTSWQSLTNGKYLPANTCSFTPTVSGTQLFRVNAREVGTAQYFPDEVTVKVNPPLSAVKLDGTPSPAAIGRPLQLYASATGGGVLGYQFFRRVGTTWESLTGGKYLPAKTCNYSPNAIGAQLFRVNAREVGTTAYFPGEVTITVQQPVSQVSIFATPAPVAVGYPLLLNASSVAVGNAPLEYQFYRQTGSSWVSLTGGKYLSVAKCSYTPVSAGEQLFRVIAREVGSTAFTPSEVIVTVNPLISAVTLAGNPPSIGLGKPLLLSAVASGGGVLEYQFFRRVGNAWESLTGGKYRTEANCSWTATVIGNQRFRVNAREVGSSSYVPGEVIIPVFVPQVLGSNSKLIDGQGGTLPPPPSQSDAPTLKIPAGALGGAATMTSNVLDRAPLPPANLQAQPVGRPMMLEESGAQLPDGTLLTVTQPGTLAADTLAITVLERDGVCYAAMAEESTPGVLSAKIQLPAGSTASSATRGFMSLLVVQNYRINITPKNGTPPMTVYKYVNGRWAANADPLISNSSPANYRVALFVHGAWLGKHEDFTPLAGYFSNLGGKTYGFYDELYAVEYREGYGIDRLGAQLAEVIAANVASDRKIDIIAHSMGGLVAREALEKSGGVSQKVNTLITLSSPHNGQSKGFIASLLSGVLVPFFTPGDLNECTVELAQLQTGSHYLDGLNTKKATTTHYRAIIGSDANKPEGFWGPAFTWLNKLLIAGSDGMVEVSSSGYPLTGECADYKKSALIPVNHNWIKQCDATYQQVYNWLKEIYGVPVSDPVLPVIPGVMYDLGALYDYISIAYDINDQGQVVGRSGRAFIWTSINGMREIGIPGNSSCATSINNSGQVVGWFVDNGVQHAFYWTPENGTTDLGTLGGTSSMATGINESGQVVGWATTTVGQRHAFIWSQATGMHDLGTMTQASSEANGINNFGTIVGTAGERAFIWTSETGMQDLGINIYPVDRSNATGINDIDQVIGSYRVNTLQDQLIISIIWTISTGVQSPFGGYRSDAFAINNSGQVVGFLRPAEYGITHARLYTPGNTPESDKMEDLGTLGGQSSIAYGINNAGQVVGSSETSNGQEHAFLRLPLH